MAKVLKSIDDIKQNMMSLLSQPDVNVAKNAMETLAENLVTPLIKESLRRRIKERVKKIYSPYSKSKYAKRYIVVTSSPIG
jgi:regulator of replication initiation timing